MLKYLRIAVTALSLTACVLLVVLWVRSYYRSDSLEGSLTGTSAFELTSERGALDSRVYSWDWGDHWIEWELKTWETYKAQAGWSRRSWWFSTSSTEWFVRCPNWFLILVSASIAAVPWLTCLRRFSLRTLLIATTLVAVGLGFIWAV